MKKIGVFCLALCLVLTATVRCFATEDVQNITITNGAHSVDAQLPVLGAEPLVNNVTSSLLMEANSNTLMHAWNADQKMSPASFVKIMTALIVAERGVLSDAVTVTEQALSSVPYDAVTADLQPDEVLTVEDLLYCMMVGSANDAAAVLAEHICGSQAAFVEAMNQYAQTLGCTGTNFTNVHGLHDDAQYITARDVARILSAAVKNETFRSAFEAVRYTVPETNKSGEREILTSNYLMNQNQDSIEIYYDKRVTGGRTGLTASRERCIAVTAEDHGMYLISVVMGAESVYQDDGYTVMIYGGYKETSELLDIGFSGYKTAQIIHPDQAMIQYPVESGNSDVVLGAKDPAFAVLPDHVEENDLIYKYSIADSRISAPVEKGQVLSDVEVWYAGSCVAYTELYAMNTVRAEQTVSFDSNKSDGSSLSHVLPVILWVTVGLCIFAAVALILSRLRIAANDRHARRHRRNRRRSR